MKIEPRTWGIAFFKDGKRGHPIPLSEDTTTFGRDTTNQIRLPDASISRHHAELRRTADGLVIKDAKSRNGIKVNGVPRSQAILQLGDLVEIGIYKFEIVAGQDYKPSNAAPPPFPYPTAASLEQTCVKPQQLSDQLQDRHLAMLCHVCYWVTEDLDAERLLPQMLSLLLDGFGVREVQLYSAKAELEEFVTETRAKKPTVRLAPFLAERCQAIPEAAIINGEKVQRHQQKVGIYNYLVAPLRQRTEPSAKAPFLVLIKPAEWVDFTTQERVLLQAICQLWVRGQSKVRQVQELRKENASLKESAAQKDHPGPRLLGRSAVMEKLRERLRKVSATKATVLIVGETGSGKEVVAQFLHENSPRASLPFVKLNCAAMPEGLIESELFGHVKGAFTDARAHHDGKFIQAHGGTLFLDEIGEMPLAVQAKLLRALETGEVEPVGSEKIKKVDVRIVAATNRDLSQMAAEGRFRQDLLFRLNVVNVRVPALREHPEDIEAIATRFLAQFCAENGLVDLALSREALLALGAHPWPGNVRELRNVIQRCAIEADGTEVSGEDVALQLGH